MTVFRGQKVLVVEDNLISFKLIEAHLLKRNLILKHASDGFEALSLYKSELNIDLIIMDVQLPGMNGLEATKAIRQFDKEVPIIAATANVFQEDRDACMAVGCSHYITKPINFPALIGLLEQYLT